MLRPPREKFNALHGETWKKLVNAHPDALEAALDTSLLEMAGDLPLETQGIHQFSVDCHQQMVGARKLINILSTLHEPKPKPAIPTTKSLNYQAGI